MVNTSRTVPTNHTNYTIEGNLSYWQAVTARRLPIMVVTNISLSDKEGWVEQIKDKEGWIEPMKDESKFCSYWETGKSYLGRSTFHGLSWISEDLPKTLKLSPPSYLSTLSLFQSFHLTY